MLLPKHGCPTGVKSNERGDVVGPNQAAMETPFVLSPDGSNGFVAVVDD
jgi:hypothetical protein